jgi:hypothetical protein
MPKETYQKPTNKKSSAFSKTTVAEMEAQQRDRPKRRSRIKYELLGYRILFSCLLLFPKAFFHLAVVDAQKLVGTCGHVHKIVLTF